MVMIIVANTRMDAGDTGHNFATSNHLYDLPSQYFVDKTYSTASMHKIIIFAL